MKWSIEYYTSKNGKSEVKDFIDGLTIEAKARVFKTFELLEAFGLGIGMPHVKSIVNIKGLWELRVRSNKNIYRFLFTIKEGRVIILLHGFQKKSRKMLSKELGKAVKRLKEIS